VSDLYPGSTSDKAIMAHCGITNQLVAGDLVLADKGFLISDIVPPGVSVNIPPFLCTGQFSREKCILTRNIARARIHVERANCRIKAFKILDFISQNYREYASKIFQVCAALVNLQYPLLSEVESRLT
jgi:DDE superfamily endonuclease